jgi:putative spermidine/putrescine transport system permease protein
VLRRLSDASFHLLMGAAAAFTLLLLFAPTLVVLVTSFNDGQTIRFPPQAYSLRQYIALADSPDIVEATRTSLIVAGAATLISTLLAVPAAIYVARGRSFTARMLDNFFMSPLILPAIAFGLALVMLVTSLGFPLSLWTLIAGHVVVIVPLILRTSVAALARLDPALLESSESLGASRFFTFRHVTLPAIRPGILAGAFIAFLSSFDNIPVSLFLADARTNVLPIRMWQLMEGSLDPRVAAVSGALVIVTLALVFAMDRWVGLGRQLK